MQEKYTSGVYYGEYSLTKGDIMRQGAIGLSLCALISFTFYRSLFVFVLSIPLGALAFPIYRKEKLKNDRLWELTIEFREAIWLVSGFLGAGYSVENAFLQAVPELKKLYGENSMIVTEFKQVSRGVRLNRPIERMLSDFAERSCCDDIKNFSEVFGIAKRSGGNMQEIIENTASVIRDKTTVSEEIKNMTASRRYEQNIMNLLPFAIIVYVGLTSEGFLDVMYESPAGRMVMTFCLLLTAASYVISQKILDIKV